jgi:galactose oxidase
MVKNGFNVLAVVTSVSFANAVSSASIAIDRDGRSATADSFELGSEPAKALDGNHSGTRGSLQLLLTLPNRIVIDMRIIYSIQAVSIQPRPVDDGNGRIGGHTIEVSTDHSLGQLVALGTYNTPTTKKTTFVTRQARYVKITATTEAQKTSNQWTSIAEINVFRDVVNSSQSPYTPPAPGKFLWSLDSLIVLCSQM